MNLKIQSVNFTAAVPGVKRVKNVQNTASSATNPIKSLQHDTFEKKEFSPREAAESLGDIIVTKNGKTEPKFNGFQIRTIEYELTREPKKWDSINTLARKNHLQGSDVVRLSRTENEKLGVVTQFANAVDYKSRPRYNAAALFELAESPTTANVLKNALPFAKTSLVPKNFLPIAQSKSQEFINKAADTVAEFESGVLNNDVEKIVLSRDKSDKTAYNVIAKTKKNELTSLLLDKNLNKDAIEHVSIYRSEKGKTYQIKKSNDFRNNTTSKVRMEYDKTGYPVVTHEIRVVKDKNNKILKTEYTSPSEVPGIFDIRVKHADGKVDVVSSGKVDKKSGITSIKKNIVSVDGTRTDYLFENDENGNRISDYKITDKNGKVLLKKSATFEVVSPNRIISSNNDDKFEILLDEKKIKVTDMKNPERNAEIDIDKKIQGNKKKILASLKEMPGEELIKLSQSTKKLVGIDSPLESYYQPGDKSIHSGDQLFVVLHELGHARDMRDLDVSSNSAYYRTLGKTIFTDSKLEKTFEEEKSNFNKAFPDAQRDHIDYFVNTLNHYGGEYGGLRETIAEGNALLTTPKTMELLAIRSQYLQQYFPRTIAHLSTLVSQEAETPKTTQKVANVQNNSNSKKV